MADADEASLLTDSPELLIPRVAPQLARGVVATVLTGLFVVALTRLTQVTSGPAETLLGAGGMAILLLLQVFYFSNPDTNLHTRLAYVLLAVEAALVYVPFLHFGLVWLGMPGMLAGSVLLVLRPAAAWPSFAAIVASMAVAGANLTGTVLDTVYAAVSTVITGLIVYGLTRLATLVTQLHEARHELAQMAVTQERLRFARDLHDLLGYSLSAITLKSELTHRLVTKQPALAREELAEILGISRQALADVRAVATGYRQLSLDDEARSARSVLAAADVDVRMQVAYRDLSVRVSTVLATLLREGITNVLRHSKAENCEITVLETDGEVTIDIVNDGVSDVPAVQDDPPGHSGSGIQNLSARVADLGGTLTAGAEGNRFRLHATLPARTAPTGRSRIGSV